MQHIDEWMTLPDYVMLARYWQNYPPINELLGAFLLGEKKPGSLAIQDDGDWDESPPEMTEEEWNRLQRIVERFN